jgi:hypothetical protein
MSARSGITRECVVLARPACIRRPVRVASTPLRERSFGPFRSVLGGCRLLDIRSGRSGRMWSRCSGVDDGALRHRATSCTKSTR